MILDLLIFGVFDFKIFLKRKGIFIKYVDKGLIIFLIVNMIFFLNELDYLKGFLVSKEEKIKVINKFVFFVGKFEKLWEVVYRILLGVVNLKGNCKYLSILRFIVKGDDWYEFEINFEWINIIKDFISGKIRYEGRLIVLLENGKVNVKVEYIVIEIKKYLEDFVSEINCRLWDEGCII